MPSRPKQAPSPSASAAAELLSPADVAKMMGVSPITVRSWVNRGWLAATTTPGGHRRFTREDVLALAGQPRGEASPRPLRLLVVDDDAGFRGYMLELLGELLPDASVEQAADGFEAGVKVAEFLPDFVLLDQSMPGLNGASVCRRIRSAPLLAAVRVIGITGHLDRRVEQEMLAAGAECVLHKPLAVDALMRALAVERTAQTRRQPAAG
jgi:excisionase family DNA binding protein